MCNMPCQDLGERWKGRRRKRYCSTRELHSEKRPEIRQTMTEHMWMNACFQAVSLPRSPNPMPLVPGLASEYYRSGNFPIISASEKLCQDGILPKHSPPSPNIMMPHLQPSFWSREYLLSSQSVSSWGFQRNMNHGPYLQKVFICLQRGMDLLEPSGEGHEADLYSVSGWGLGKAGSGGFCWLCSN